MGDTVGVVEEEGVILGVPLLLGLTLGVPLPVPVSVIVGERVSLPVRVGVEVPVPEPVPVPVPEVESVGEPVGVRDRVEEVEERELVMMIGICRLVLNLLVVGRSLLLLLFLLLHLRDQP